MCEISVFWFRDRVWWKAATLSIIGACLVLWVSGSHTASQWKTPNSSTSPCTVLTGLKVRMQIEIVIWGWWWQKGQWATTFFPITLSRKTALSQLSTSVYSTFSLPMQSPGALTGVEQHKKVSSDFHWQKQKGIKWIFCLFGYCILLSFILVILIRKENAWALLHLIPIHQPYFIIHFHGLCVCVCIVFKEKSHDFLMAQGPKQTVPPFPITTT